MEIEMQGFTAVLDELTKTTYIMIVVHDTSIGMFASPWKSNSYPSLRNRSYQNEHTSSATKV
jgi:hypothetical protein